MATIQKREPRPATRLVLGYVVAVVGTAVAALLHWGLVRWVGELPPYIAFYPVVIVSSAVGGTAPGLLATALSALAVDLLFMDPAGKLAAFSAANAVGMGLFMIVNTAISFVGGGLRSAHDRLTERARDLDALLQAQRQSEAEARGRTEELSAFLEAVPALTFIAHDPECRRISGSRATRQLLRASEGANLSMSAPEGEKPTHFQFQQGGRELPPDQLPMQVAAATGREVRNFDLTVAFADGASRDFFGRAVPLFDASGKVRGAVGAFVDITEHKQAQARVVALSRRLAADLAGMERLHEISTRFARQEDLPSLLYGILDAAIAITRAHKGNIQLLHAASDELGIAAQRGFDPDFVEFFSHIHPGTAACGTAIKARQCVVVEDVTQSPIFLVEARALELMLAAGVRAVVCTPLMTRSGPLVGVLSVHFDAPHRPSEADLRLLDLLARQAADFIERTHTEESLCATREALARANAGLERTVQERTAKLEETVAELEHFSYTITHDMRAPLRAMQAFGDLLLGECSECVHPVRRDYIRRIADAAERMDKLVLDALNYSNVLRQKWELTPVDTGALLRGIVESYPHLQPPKAQILIDEHLPWVLGNQAGLTQCFSNLLGNAVKFVAPGQLPQVRVRAEAVPAGRQEREDSGWRMEDGKTTDHGPLTDQSLNSQPSTLNSSVRLWFEDNGIGIPKAEQDRIWVMFQRLNKGFEGTGIGLALVRKMVQRMGGQVGVESEPGRGSRFWIELRQAAPGGPARTLELDAASLHAQPSTLNASS